MLAVARINRMKIVQIAARSREGERLQECSRWLFSGVAVDT
jgi:hypothetical protein